MNSTISSHSNQDKPNVSYIALIGMAILSTPDRRMLLSEVYQWIMSHFSYFHGKGSGWRNSVRHNLSLNECFVKSGRASNGKGHFWTIHDACIHDFMAGDFSRRNAQGKVRLYLGLSTDQCSHSILNSVNCLHSLYPSLYPSLPSDKKSFTIDSILYSK